MKDFLKEMEILTQQRVDRDRSVLSESELYRQADSRGQPLDFLSALRSQKCGVIAEVKRRSPSSRGESLLSRSLVEQAQVYAEEGACAISVLTEPVHFGGEIGDLTSIRAAVPHLPVLMKDFVIDPLQILQARAAGADAVLLILSLVKPTELQKLADFAFQLGLQVLAEVRSREEFITALAMGFKIIGINNRNLHDLQIDFSLARELATGKPEGQLLICESGIKTREQIVEFSNLGFDAFLIGHSLAADPYFLSSLLGREERCI